MAVVLRRAAAGVAAVLSLLLALGPVPAALADHGAPSASDVAAGKSHVAQLERQVAAAADAVTRAQSSLDRLRTNAEVAVESYDRAQVVQGDAERAVTAARVAVAAADARVAATRSDLAHFAVAAYEGGGMSSLDAVLSSGGPASMLDKLGTLDAVARSQRDALSALRAATVYDAVVRQLAADRLHEASAAAARADTARRTAQSAVATQVAGVTALTAAQHRLATTLTQARAHVGALERARLAALARQRAEAAAARRAAAERAARLRAQRPPAVSTGGGGGVTTTSSGSSGAATVSAATEQSAVRAAESQLGKPYQWGATGPDSYDCSGLVMWAYAQVGVNVDHWTGYQWNEGEHIALADLRPGDLVFFATDTGNPDTIHHVGMYIGNGQMVEAPYTGANVRISGAFRPDLIGAVRLYNR